MKQRDRAHGVLKRMRAAKRKHRKYTYTWRETYPKAYVDAWRGFLKGWIDDMLGPIPTHDMRKHPRVVDYTLQPKCIQLVRRNRCLPCFPSNDREKRERSYSKKAMAGFFRRMKRREEKHPRFKHLPEGMKTPVFFAASVN